MSKNTKSLRIAVLLSWVFALAASFMPQSVFYHALASVTAVFAAMLIYSSRATQGHYRNISQAYMIGSLIWAFEELLRTIDIIIGGSDMLIICADNISYIPLVFFSGGLLLLTQSEYNRLHFERMTLNTFAISFFSFMIVQKFVLFHYAGIQVTGFGMFLYMVYFFLCVFTITLIISIFVQTNFKGHTFGTNVSAIMLTWYCMLEIDRLYRTMSDGSPRWLFFEPIGLLGLVVYSWAQSDPALKDRAIEPDELKPDEQVKNIFIIGNFCVFLVIGFILYLVHFFDTRDLYLLIIAVLSYAMLYKSLQARVYNELRIKQQLMENQRLEEMVEEKTKELREANEELRIISETDALTGLYNRRYGRELVQSLADAEDKRPFAFMLMDLDHFKQVNDTYGHETGDMVLKEVGRRLNNLADKGGIAVRLGGDEFVVVIPEKDDEPVRLTAKRVAEEICEMMDQPIDTDDGEMVVPACTGIGLFPDNAEDPDLLYHRTDEAMYDIKHNSTSSSYKFID